MDTKVESDSNRIGHEHSSFRWSLLSNFYVRVNICLFSCFSEIFWARMHAALVALDFLETAI